MHRFFIPREWIDGSTVGIRGQLVHQLRHVLRLRSGDNIIVLDNSGWEYEVELKSVAGEHIEGVVKGKSLSPAEPRTRITLYQALLKGRSFELVLQKCTELGVVGFVPVVCERCAATRSRSLPSSKIARWQKIILEAAEQSRRAKLPQLYPLTSFEEACRSARGLSLLSWEEEENTSLRTALQSYALAALPNEPFSVNLFIGPEGGFPPLEVEFARSQSIMPVTLGRRVLRAETAGLVAAAAILYECGDLG